MPMTLFGIAIYNEVSAWQLVALCAAYALAFIIKGIFGYGAVPPMILMGSLVMPPHQAVLLAALVNLATQGFLLPDGLRDGQLAIAGRMMLFIMPALVVGTFLFQILSADDLQVAVGALLLGLLLLEGSSLKARIEPYAQAHRPVFSALAAIIAGLISGVVGGGAMVFLSVYLRTLIPEKTAFRGTVILIISGILIWRVLLLLGFDLLTLVLAVEALTLIPVALIALGVGRGLSRMLSNQAFFKLYQWFMMASAAMLILRGAL